MKFDNLQLIRESLRSFDEEEKNAESFDKKCEMLGETDMKKVSSFCFEWKRSELSFRKVNLIFMGED